MENELFDATHLVVEYLETESPVIFVADCVIDDYEPMIHGNWYMLAQ